MSPSDESRRPAGRSARGRLPDGMLRAVLLGVGASAIVWIGAFLMGLRLQPVVLVLVVALASLAWWARGTSAGPLVWPDPLATVEPSEMSTVDPRTRRLARLIRGAGPDSGFEAGPMARELTEVARQTCADTFGTALDAPLEDLRPHLGDAFTDYLLRAQRDPRHVPPLTRRALRAHLRVLRACDGRAASATAAEPREAAVPRLDRRLRT